MRNLIRNALSVLVGPSWAGKLTGFLGGYNATDPRRKIVDPQVALSRGKTTANQLLNGNLSQLRSYCRNLERNNPTARAAVEGLTALVVGSGIALEPDTGDADLDAQISDVFSQWLAHCGVNGESIDYLMCLGFREVVVAGESIWRLVNDSDDLFAAKVLPLDAEWLRDDEGGTSDLTTVSGVVIDNLGRPQAYLLQNPETDLDAENVPAQFVIHSFERRRPVQHRGEPWFAPVIETLMQERDLVDAELKAAVNTASLGIAVESEFHDTIDTSEFGSSDDPVQDLRLGSVVRMYPGEKVTAFSHTRPSQQISPFRQMLRGDIAASMRLAQRFLDRDVSRANYSSMRADMIDSERLLGPVRDWYGHQTIGRLYTQMLPLIAAYLKVGVPRARYRLLPDGQPYVDPQKDVAAATNAIAAGLSTYESEISKRGGDWKQVWEQARREQQFAEELGIKLDLSSTNAPAPQSSIGKVEAPKAPQPTTEDPEDPEDQDEGDEE